MKKYIRVETVLGERSQDIFQFFKTNLSTLARSCTLRSSAMIFFDWEEAPSSSPKMGRFAQKPNFPLGGLFIIDIGG